MIHDVLATLNYFDYFFITVIFFSIVELASNLYMSRLFHTLISVFKTITSVGTIILYGFYLIIEHDTLESRFFFVTLMTGLITIRAIIQFVEDENKMSFILALKIFFAISAFCLLSWFMNTVV